MKLLSYYLIHFKRIMTMLVALTHRSLFNMKLLNYFGSVCKIVLGYIRLGFALQPA